jgi:HEAT repeat protein
MLAKKLVSKSGRVKGKMIRNLLLAAACSFTLMAEAPVAEAGTGGSEGTIRSAVRSTNADAIISALEQAEHIPCSTNCMTMVMELLENDDYRIRQVAAWWFARRPAQMKEVTERAVAWLSLNDSVQARNGADVLGTIGYAKFIPVLTTAAQKSSFTPEARGAVIQALGNIANKDANPVVADAMRDADASVRHKAVLAWANMLKQTDAQPVAALVEDSDLVVRRAAIATVGKFRTSEARVSLENVVINDPDPATRRNAAWALGRIGNAASSDALRAASTDASSMVRMTAKVALSKLR